MTLLASVTQSDVEMEELRALRLYNVGPSCGHKALFF